MSKLPIIVPAAAVPAAAANGPRAMVPAPPGRSAPEPRPLLPIEVYRTRQFGAEARRTATQFDRSDRGPGVVLDAEYVTGDPRSGALTTGAYSAQVVARTVPSDNPGLFGQRAAMAYGSEAYRRAGAEPSLAPETASVVNLAV